MERSDSELLRAIAEGDRDSATLLVRRHMDRVYSFVRGFTGRVADAEDIVQETFIEAYRSAHRFDGQRSPVAWLLGIASHRCLSWRRRNRRPSILLDDLPQSGMAEGGGAQNRGSSEADAIAVRLDVERAVCALPPKYRIPILLRCQQELSHAEIGRALGISAATAAQRVHRARHILRSKLAFLVEGREEAN